LFRAISIVTVCIQTVRPKRHIALSSTFVNDLRAYTTRARGESESPMHRLTAAERHLFVQEASTVAKRWRQQVDERLKDLGLTEARWSALYWLHGAPAGLSQTALAERAGVEAATLVRTLDLLERQGLVRREPSPRDRRVNVVRVTPAAAPLVEKVEALEEQLASEAFDDFSLDEYRALITLLQRVRMRLQSLGPPAATAAASAA